jgi:hypothetical protein
LNCFRGCNSQLLSKLVTVETSTPAASDIRRIPFATTYIIQIDNEWYSLVFSAAEHESAFVIDGLMRNNVVKSDIHSTDTHGFSEAIFAVTHLLGCTYAPRIKNLKKMHDLILFRNS